MRNIIRISRLALRMADSIVDITVLFCLLLLFCVGGYAVWDNNRIYEGASQKHYEKYKPEKDSTSFDELRKQNPDVFAWLTVYGTNIDYPLVQGEDNDKYMNQTVLGEYSVSGSLFLDYRNKRDFSDFNSIIFGHHMEKQKMFGEIGEFKDESYFWEHQYGSLYYDDQLHGVEFVAILEVNAHDGIVYTPGVTSVEQKQALLDYIPECALHMRDTSLSTEDRLIFLSTCAPVARYGREVLVGKITESPEKNPFE